MITKQDMENAVYIRDAGPDWGTVRYAGAAGWCAVVKLEGKRKKIAYKDTLDQVKRHVDILMDGI